MGGVSPWWHWERRRSFGVLTGESWCDDDKHTCTVCMSMCCYGWQWSVRPQVGLSVSSYDLPARVNAQDSSSLTDVTRKYLCCAHNKSCSIFPNTKERSFSVSCIASFSRGDTGASFRKGSRKHQILIHSIWLFMKTVNILNKVKQIMRTFIITAFSISGSEYFNNPWGNDVLSSITRWYIYSFYSC